MCSRAIRRSVCHGSIVRAVSRYISLSTLGLNSNAFQNESELNNSHTTTKRNRIRIQKVTKKQSEVHLRGQSVFGRQSHTHTHTRVAVDVRGQHQHRCKGVLLFRRRSARQLARGDNQLAFRSRRLFTSQAFAAFATGRLVSPSVVGESEGVVIQPTRSDFRRR